MTKKIVKRTDANNETLYFYTHSDAVDVGEGSSTKSLTEVIDDTLHKSAQTLTNAEKTQVYANLGLNGVDDVPTENSNNIVRSGGVKSAIDDVIDDFTNRGYMYNGIAPASAPLGEDKTFYIAKSGEYSAYTGIGDGSFTLNGIAVLTYATATTSGAWTKNDIVLFDEEPTANSNNLVKSGGVKNELALGSVYDVSAKNPTAGSNSDGKWESLSALLTDANLSTLIPTSVRKGGMSIKFVQSSDNKYVQYFLTKDEWSASKADWQKLNLEEEVRQLGQELNKLCKEKGVVCSFTNSKYIDLGNGVGNPVSLTPQRNVSFQYAITPCKAGDIVSITAAGGATSSRTWGFIDANNILLSVADAPGVQLTDEKLTAPANTAFVIINTKTAPDCYVISADNIPARLVPFTDTKDGFVPAPNGGTGFLKSDGTWATLPEGGTTAIIDGETYNGITLVATDEKKLVARVGATLDIDSVAYEGKTYREIFETGNELGINPGFDNGSYSPLVVGAGTPTIVSDVYDTAPNSLKCYGSTSQQLRTSGYGPRNSNVFLAFRGYCTRYASGGGLGVILGSFPARLNEVTTGFVTRSAIVNANGGGYNLYVGTYQSSNCDGYIDSPVAIDLSMFTNEPTLEEMTTLYETYLSIKKGEQIIADIPMIDVSVPSVEPAVSKTKFVSVMNEYAKQAGMGNSIFYEPSGASLLNQSTAEDICRLALVACANDKLQQYWGWETYTINIMGENARTQVVTNTYKGTHAATLAADYHIFGGKSGSLSYSGETHRNLFSVVKSKVDDSWLIGCIMLSTVTDRFKPMKELFDWLEQKRVNPSVADPTLDCSYACAGVVPNGNPCSFRDMDWMLCKYSATTQQAPFSMTKVLTTLVSLDYCKPDEIIEVKASDVDIYGSGNYFQDGDKLTFRELLIGMLLPSSNTLANTICRVVGEKIVRMNK